MRKEVPFILMLLFAAARFSMEAFNGLSTYKAGADNLIDVMGYAITFMLQAGMFVGVLNLLRVHGNIVRKRRANWAYSIWLLVILFAYLGYGLVKSNSDAGYMWVWNCTFVPLDATMFSIIAFFIASAAYRAFRVRSVEAGAMLVTAFIVMLAQVPIGEVIWGTTGWLGGIPGISNWILSIPNAAAVRALNLGVFLGFMATQTRVLLGIERRFLGQDR